jgi:hypothetical protein
LQAGERAGRDTERQADGQTGRQAMRARSLRRFPAQEPLPSFCYVSSAAAQSLSVRLSSTNPKVSKR